MGLSISCHHFEEISSFLERATKVKACCQFIMHYLDDFLFIRPFGSCAHVLAQFEELCCELGVPLAEGKMEGLSSTLMFLGIELDSATMQLPAQGQT